MKPRLKTLLPTLQGFGTAVLARRTTLAGPAILAVFCLASLWIWVPPMGGDAQVPETGPQDLTARLAEHRAEIAALIPVTGERPLFQADRRPVAAPEAPAPAPEATLLLVGILADGEARMALVRRSTSPELFRIEAGGRLGPWQILSVDITSITVGEADGSTFTLQLDG
jgi:hypothetical protein